MMPRRILMGFLLGLLIPFVLGVGEVYKPLVRNGADGIVIASGLTWTNQMKMTEAPSDPEHLLRSGDVFGLSGSPWAWVSNNLLLHSNYLIVSNINARIQMLETEGVESSSLYGTNWNNGIEVCGNMPARPFSAPVAGNTNVHTFHHGKVPAGHFLVIDYIQPMLINGEQPGTESGVLVYDVGSALTVAFTNECILTNRSTYLIGGGSRYYFQFVWAGSSNVTATAYVRGKVVKNLYP